VVSVEGWNGDEIEEHEHTVELEHDPKKDEQALRRAPQYEKEFQEEKTGDCRNKIRCNPGNGNQDFIPVVVSKIIGIHRTWFPPPDQSESRAEDHQEQGDEDGTDGVDVGNRIEGHPSHICSGRITASIRHPGVTCLMNGNGKKEHRGLKYDDRIKGHQRPPSSENAEGNAVSFAPFPRLHQPGHLIFPLRDGTGKGRMQPPSIDNLLYSIECFCLPPIGGYSWFEGDAGFQHRQPGILGRKEGLPDRPADP